MCQHIEPKKNRWYYRRRIPRDCRELHRDSRTGKLPDQIYFSLKTNDKAVASGLAVSHTRRLDAMWKAHRAGSVDPKISIARLEAAGLSPGDGAKYPDLDPVTDFVDDLLGRSGPHTVQKDSTRERPSEARSVTTGVE